jgi:hypothetical protein
MKHRMTEAPVPVLTAARNSLHKLQLRKERVREADHMRQERMQEADCTQRQERVQEADHSRMKQPVAADLHNSVAMVAAQMRGLIHSSHSSAHWEMPRSLKSQFATY